MAFNLGGFLMGASTQLVKSIEEEEERLQDEKLLKEERDYQKAEYKRRMDLTRDSDIAAEDRANQKELDNLMEQAVFHFGAENAATLAKRGKGYLMQAINLGNTANAAGRSGKHYMSVNNNNIEAAKEDLNKATINVGDQTEQALPTTPTITFDFERLGRDIKQNEATSLDDLLSLNTVDIMNAVKNGDANTLSVLNQKQKSIIDAMNKADPETVEAVFSNPLTFFNTMRGQAIGDAGSESGEIGQILSKVNGDPLFGATMDYDAAVRMENSVSGYSNPKLTANVTPFIKEEIKSAEQDFKSKTTDIVREFQTGTVFGGPSNTGGMVGGRQDILYVKVAGGLPELEKTNELLTAAKVKPKRGVTVIITDSNGATRVALNTEVLRKGSKYYTYDLE
jgi:hypothetical protein